MKLIGWFLSHDPRTRSYAPGKSERRFHYERACRASTFEITNLRAQKTQYVNGPYGCFFLPEHLQVSGGGQTES